MHALKWHLFFAILLIHFIIWISLRSQHSLQVLFSWISFHNTQLLIVIRNCRFVFISISIADGQFFLFYFTIDFFSLCNTCIVNNADDFTYFVRKRLKKRTRKYLRPKYLLRFEAEGWNLGLKFGGCRSVWKGKKNIQRVKANECIRVFRRKKWKSTFSS